MTTHEKDQLNVIARILETLVPQTDFSIPDDSNEVAIYRDELYRSLLAKKFGKLFKAFAHGVNCLLTRTQSYHLQVSCLRLLHRALSIVTNQAAKGHLE